jgi:hypothetical protein
MRSVDIDFANGARRTSIRDPHTKITIPYVYDYITKLSRRYAEGIQIIRTYTSVYVPLDKENPYTGNKTACARQRPGLLPFTCVTALRNAVRKVRNNLLYRPALTEDLSM